MMAPMTFAGIATPVLINEFTAKGTEWVELYNPTGASVDLTGWKLSDGEGDDLLSGSIAAGGYIVQNTSLNLKANKSVSSSIGSSRSLSQITATVISDILLI